MPVCPTCKADYPVDARECPDCGRPTRRRWLGSGRRVGGEQAVVKIAEIASEPLALMWAEMLRREGIPCSVKGTGVWSPVLPVELREHYLYVRATDASRAASLLAPHAEREDAIALEHARRPRRWRPQGR